MENVMLGQRAAFAVLEPLLAYLVAANVEVPHGLGHAAEPDCAGHAGLVFHGCSCIQPDSVVRPADMLDHWLLGRRPDTATSDTMVELCRLHQVHHSKL